MFVWRSTTLGGGLRTTGRGGSSRGGGRTPDGNEDGYGDEGVERVMRIEGCEVRVRKYWWGDVDASMLEDLSLPDPDGPVSPSHYDLVLVSDCVLPRLYPVAPLTNAILALLGPHTVTLVSY